MSNITVPLTVHYLYSMLNIMVILQLAAQTKRTMQLSYLNSNANCSCKKIALKIKNGYSGNLQWFGNTSQGDILISGRNEIINKKRSKLGQSNPTVLEIKLESVYFVFHSKLSRLRFCIYVNYFHYIVLTRKCFHKCYVNQGKTQKMVYSQ